METELSAERGLFIAVEGIEGSGKSTHMSFIVNYLRSGGHEVVATREPGGTAVGEAIREVLLKPQEQEKEMAVETETLLMFAARAQHLAEVIEPALASGAWIVSDRFTEATYAYQGGGRGMPFSRIAVLEEWVQGALTPDLTLLLDVSPEVGLARIGQRGEQDRFDGETQEFFEQVRAVYLRRAAQQPGRYIVIDAEQAIEQVKKSISDVLDRVLENAGRTVV